MDIYLTMKKKLLPWIIALSALSVSGSAAFYSVTGLGKMFAGASLQVMVLAGSLEFAKLVTASLLYQYWKKLNLGLKLYLSIATLILIIITSAGIYGFLSSAYQETAFKVQNQDKNIDLLDKNISIIQTEIKNFESQVKQKNDRLLQLTNIRTNLQSTQDVLIEKSKSTSAVRQQIKDVDSEIKRMDTEVSVLNDSISSKNTKIASIEQQKMGVSSNADLAKEVGPLKYIAKLTGSNIDSVVNWYIIILMLVFDPLAIALVIAANFAFEMSEEKEKEKEKMEKEKENNFLKKVLGKISLFKTEKKENLSDDTVEHVEEKREEKDQSHPEESINYDLDTQEQENHEIFNTTQDEPVITENFVDEENTNTDIENTENKTEDEDKYNREIILENQKIARNKFRNNAISLDSRENFKNNKGAPNNENPLNLR